MHAACRDPCPHEHHPTKRRLHSLHGLTAEHEQARARPRLQGDGARRPRPLGAPAPHGLADRRGCPAPPQLGGPLQLWFGAERPGEGHAPPDVARACQRVQRRRRRHARLRGEVLRDVCGAQGLGRRRARRRPTHARVDAAQRAQLVAWRHGVGVADPRGRARVDRAAADAQRERLRRLSPPRVASRRAVQPGARGRLGGPLRAVRVDRAACVLRSPLRVPRRRRRDVRAAARHEGAAARRSGGCRTFA